MHRLRTNKRAALLASRVRNKPSPRKRTVKNQTLSDRARRIVALIPPDDSEGPSSSDDEDRAGLINCNKEIEGFEVNYLDDNMKATLEDIIKDIPTPEELFEQESQLITIPGDQEPSNNLDFEIFENLSSAQSTIIIQKPQDTFLGPSTSAGTYDGFDHYYSCLPTTQQYPTCSNDEDLLTDTSVIDSPSVRETQQPDDLTPYSCQPTTRLQPTCSNDKVLLTNTSVNDYPNVLETQRPDVNLKNKLSNKKHKGTPEIPPETTKPRCKVKKNQKDSY